MQDEIFSKYHKKDCVNQVIYENNFAKLKSIFGENDFHTNFGFYEINNQGLKQYE